MIYAYDNVDKVEKSSENGEVRGVLINSTMYLRESEIKQVARLIKDEKLRNRVLTLMRSHRRIYEVLDIADTDNKPQLQAYHDARWGGIGIAEARDLLIPQLRKLRVGWNGNFGISNAGLAYNSKLAYEMLKAILYACRQGDGTVLKVTDEPLMFAPGKSNIHAL